MTGNFYFEWQDGGRTLLGENVTVDESWKLLTAFLKDHNYKAPYYRMWTQDNETWYDFGSHVQFGVWVNHKE